MSEIRPTASDHSSRDDEIILEGSFEVCRKRWIFSQITATSFQWRNI